MGNQVSIRNVILAALISILVAPCSWSEGGKLLATAGVTQVEGSAGGGLVPWAVLAGYDTREGLSAGVFSTQVRLDDYRLNAWGVNWGIKDRLELSLFQQTFDLTSLGDEIRQNIYGVKWRLYGDVVYSAWPQVSFGLQHKRLLDPAIAAAVGADNSTKGTDAYLVASKVHLGAALGYNLVWSLNARYTKANELGLLGFGGLDNASTQIQFEGSLGLLLSQNVVIGIEYRQKPDNLGLGEDDWRDLFIAYIPNKSFSFTAAWAQLGSIAAAPDQQGVYLSLSGHLW